MTKLAGVAFIKENELNVADLKFFVRNGIHIFNLGSGTGSTVLEVIQAFSKACGKVKHILRILN